MTTSSSRRRPPGAHGALPAGLHVVVRPPAGDGDDPRPVVVLVHGSLDRGSSFARVARRLPTYVVVTYDRRGYQRSRAAGVVGLEGHADDLLAVAGAFGEGRRVTAVGHSVGGTVVLAAAARRPAAFVSVAAYEPSMPWLGFNPPRPPPAAGTAGDPGGEVERFFRRMVGGAAWERLGEEARKDRIADGPALVADLASVRSATPFDVTALAVPLLVAAGGRRSAPHHVRTARWVAGHVTGARLEVLPEAAHGAHLSHPDGFARLVRRAVDMGAMGAMGEVPVGCPGAGVIA